MLLAYRVVFEIETTLIFIGNGFTIFVFWYQRQSLKRASCLLINLAIADCLVGARELINMTGYNDRMMISVSRRCLIVYCHSLCQCFSVFFVCYCVGARLCSALAFSSPSSEDSNLCHKHTVGLACWFLRSNGEWISCVWLSKATDFVFIYLRHAFDLSVPGFGDLHDDQNTSAEHSPSVGS